MALQLVAVPNTNDSPMRLKDLNLKRAFQRGDIDVETCLFALQKNVKQRLVEWEAEAPQDEAPQDEVPRHATCAGIAYDTHLNAVVRCCTNTSPASRCHSKMNLSFLPKMATTMHGAKVLL